MFKNSRDFSHQTTTKTQKQNWIYLIHHIIITQHWRKCLETEGSTFKINLVFLIVKKYFL